MTAVRRRRLERRLVFVLAHWYAFYLVVGYESLRQSGTGWIAELPWGSFATEAWLALGSAPLSAGALLLVAFTALLVATSGLLVHTLNAVFADSDADSDSAPAAAAAPGEVRGRETAPAGGDGAPADAAARPAGPSSAAGTATAQPGLPSADPESERLQALVGRFRQRVARL